MQEKIGGVLPVVHTAFDRTDRIDWASMARQLDWAFEQGANGFCIGMVSELLRLTFAERIELTERLGALNADRGWYVSSAGAESTRQAVELAQHAQGSGCHAVMAMPPVSSVLPDNQIVDYFTAIADSVSVPVIVQDASGYIGQPIPVSVYAELLERYGADRIWFKPEASPVGAVISELRRVASTTARVFDGSGGHLLIDSYRRGLVGTIPGMEFLEGIVAIWRALEEGDEEAAYRVYFPLCALVTLQLQAGLDGFLAIEKYLLHQRGLIGEPLRRTPFAWSMDEATRAEVDRLMEYLRWALG